MPVRLMNHRIILSYLCIIGFLALLAFAYWSYSNKAIEHQTEELKQDVIAAIRNSPVSSNNAFDPTKLEDIIKSTIIKNPEVVVQALETYQINRAQAHKAQIAQKINELRDVIANNPKDPRVGSPNPKVKVIEFFDYSCGYCRKMFMVNQQLLQNPDVQFIFKETPILGENSFLASRVSLAVYTLNPEKYLMFQQALWNNENRTMESMIKDAVNLGVSENELRNLLNDKTKVEAIDAVLTSNQQLAIKTGIEGTPSYIINDQFIAGALSYDQMNKIIRDTIAQQPLTSQVNQISPQTIPSPMPTESHNDLASPPLPEASRQADTAPPSQPPATPTSSTTNEQINQEEQQPAPILLPPSDTLPISPPTGPLPK